MGYAIRFASRIGGTLSTLKWDGASLKPLWNETHSVELYNRTEDDAFVPPPPPNGGEWERRDDYEDVNVATAAPKELLQTLAKKLRAVVEMAVARSLSY